METNDLTKKLCSKLITRVSGQEAKKILMAAVESGEIYSAIESSLGDPKKRERKQKADKP